MQVAQLQAALARAEAAAQAPETGGSGRLPVPRVSETLEAASQEVRGEAGRPGVGARDGPQAKPRDSRHGDEFGQQSPEGDVARGGAEIPARREVQEWGDNVVDSKGAPDGSKAVSGSTGVDGVSSDASSFKSGRDRHIPEVGHMAGGRMARTVSACFYRVAPTTLVGFIPVARVAKWSPGIDL